MKHKLLIIALIAVLATALLVYGATQLNLTIPTGGIISGGNITASVAAIEWGNLTVGQTVTRQFTITNTGTNTTGALNMTTATTIGTVTWNAEGIVLSAGQSTVVIVTLVVNPEATSGPFAFPLYIKA